MKRYLSYCLTALLSLGLAGCTANLSPDVYSGSEVGVAAKTVPATVVAMRPVTIDNQSGMGGLAGAGAGAAAGSAIGGSTQSNIVGAIGGAVVGGVAGQAIEKTIARKQGYEYILKLHNGSLTSIVQQEDLQLQVGQRVLIIYSNPVRIVPDFRPTPKSPAPKTVKTGS